MLLQELKHCYYCEVELPNSEATKDHIIALSKGGIKNVKNVVIACRICNTLKSNLSLHEFHDKVKFIDHPDPDYLARKEIILRNIKKLHLTIMPYRDELTKKDVGDGHLQLVTKTEFAACPKCDGAGFTFKGNQMRGNGYFGQIENCYYCNGSKTVIVGIVEFKNRPITINMAYVRERRLSDLEQLLFTIHECIEETGSDIKPDSILHNRIKDFLNI